MGLSRLNWLDQCRLLFAALVIVCHAFQLQNLRDPLQQAGAATDLGKLAVAGFLLISGYLIARALDRGPSLADYLRNRALRIAPAFWVAFVVSVVTVLAVGGSGDGRFLFLEFVTLHQPSAAYPSGRWAANGAMWTIQLEAACYLLAPALTATGRRLAAAWVMTAVATVLSPEILPTGEPLSWWLRGILMFLSGAAYYRFDLRARSWPIMISAIALCVSLAFPWAWELGVATAGGYLLLSLGLRERPEFAWSDFSYGLYLYGWPIQVLLILFGVTTPYALSLSALTLGLLAGALSWKFVEAPALQLKARLQRGPAPA